MGAGDDKQLYVSLDAGGGPLALGNGCKTSDHCSTNAAFLALD